MEEYEVRKHFVLLRLTRIIKINNQLMNFSNLYPAIASRLVAANCSRPEGQL